MLVRAAAAALSLLLVLSVAACGSAGATGEGVTVSGAWVRSASAGGQTAAYFTITNGTARDETLAAVSMPAAASASLHRTSTGSGGMTGMEPVGGIHVPAGGTSVLEPGGFHVMLEGLTGDLVAGRSVKLTLVFEGVGEVEVTAEVRAS